MHLICVVGNYEEIEPNERQLGAIVKLMTALAEKYKVSPSEIKGHLDYSKMTVCPGKKLTDIFQADISGKWWNVIFQR